MSKTYRNQFRDRKQHAFNSQFEPKSTGRSPPKRPTAVKQSSPRSDYYAAPTKRNDIHPQVLRDDPIQQNFRRIPPKERSIRHTPPPFDNRRGGNMNKNESTRNIRNDRKSSYDEDFPRRPLRFASKPNGTHRSSSPPAHDRKSVPIPRNAPLKQRRVPITNDDYIIERRRKPARSAYDDYQSDGQHERRRPEKVLRVVREPPYRNDDYDDGYYVEPSRRPAIVRRAPAREYVFVDETDEPVRRSRSRRSDVVYVDDDRSVRYEDEVIYVDEYGNEVDVVDERSPSRRRYVEYIDDDDDDEGARRRHPRKTKVIYVGDDTSSKPQGDKSKSKQPSSTQVVYE